MDSGHGDGGVTAIGGRNDSGLGDGIYANDDCVCDSIGQCNSLVDGGTAGADIETYETMGNKQMCDILCEYNGDIDVETICA